MFLTSILVIFYSYIVFFIGIAEFLYKEVVAGISILFIVLSIIIFRTKIKASSRVLLKGLKQSTKLERTILILIITIAFINFIGVLAPETSFDALWYHLTLPKLYLQNSSIFFVPGGLFYYSVMPKLGEMLYVGALSIGSEQLAKFTHFLFGIGSIFALYNLSRTFLPRSFSLLACLIFYANLVVVWESTTAYVDLIRTFYEILALYAFLKFYEVKKVKWIYLSACMVGAAISTKLIAFGTLMIFLVLFIAMYIKVMKPKRLLILGQFLLISVLIPLPWFIFSYLLTHNTVYPFFTSIYPVAATSFSIQEFMRDIINLFLYSSDPISPVYFTMLPFVIMYFLKFKPPIKIIAYYCLLALIIWYFTPRTGGGRFILPYLPAFSLLTTATIYAEKDAILKRIMIGVAFLVAFITIAYRSVAVSNSLGVVLGFETKDSYLSRELNFSFGDFYDIDGYLSKTVQPDETVLIIGGHNLYYVPFRFIHTSFEKEVDRYSYVMTQNANLPNRFKKWKKIYTNERTKVTLYKKP